MAYCHLKRLLFNYQAAPRSCDFNEKLSTEYKLDIRVLGGDF